MNPPTAGKFVGSVAFALNFIVKMDSDVSSGMVPAKMTLESVSPTRALEEQRLIHPLIPKDYVPLIH